MEPLTEYFSSGLMNGDTCIAIATPYHLQELNERLISCGFDISAAYHSGQYIALDAEQTLAKFMVNDLPDRDRFFDVIGTTIEMATKNGQPVRAFGEMVALLWKAGNKPAVLQLENLWNELAKVHIFSLYCAYPELHFILDPKEQKEIQACHNLIYPHKPAPTDNLEIPSNK